MALNKPRFETFVGTDGKHYWRLKARNGKVIAIGGEGYETHGAVEQAVFGLIGIVQASFYDVEFNVDG